MVQCPEQWETETENVFSTSAYKFSGKPHETVLRVATDTYLCRESFQNWHGNVNTHTRGRPAVSSRAGDMGASSTLYSEHGMVVKL